MSPISQAACDGRNACFVLSRMCREREARRQRQSSSPYGNTTKSMMHENSTTRYPVESGLDLGRSSNLGASGPRPMRATNWFHYRIVTNDSAIKGSTSMKLCTCCSNGLTLRCADA